MKFVILFTILSRLVWIGSGQNNEQETNKLIQKICKIAKDKLHIHTYTPEDRIQILNTLKRKFLKAAKSHGFETSAYIRLIVQGLTILLDGKNYQKLCMDSITDVERRSIYQNLTTESTNSSVTDTISSNETTLGNFRASNITNIFIKSNISMDRLFSKIDTLIENTIEKSATSEAEEVNVQKVKNGFSEDFQKSPSDELNLTKQLEIGVDKAIEKHTSVPRILDVDTNSNITNPVAQMAEKSPTEGKQLNKSEKTTDQEKAGLNSKIDTLNKTVNKSPFEKHKENAQNVNRRFLGEFEKSHGHEANFTKQPEVGVDNAIEKHIRLRRILDEENNNAHISKLVAEVAKEPPNKEKQLNKSKISKDEDEARLFSKIETLIKKTIVNSPFEKQQENAQKVKRKFLKDFRKSNNDDTNFIQQLEKRFDYLINKHLNMRRRSDGRNVTTRARNSRAEIAQDPYVKEKIFLDESKTATDKVRLFSKIDTLIQKTVEKSSIEKQEKNVEKVKRRFLKEFRKSHNKENNFIQLLEKRFDEAIDKHMVMQRMSDDRNPNLREDSEAELAKENQGNKLQYLNESELVTDKDKATHISKIETAIQKSVDEYPYKKQKEYMQKIKRRFLDDFRKFHVDEIYQMEQTLDATIKKYMSIQRQNEKSNVHTADPSAQIAEEALMESGRISNNIPNAATTDRLTTTKQQFLGVTKEYDSCSDVLANACNDLKNLDVFTCEKDSAITVSSIQVCDGNSDCPDGSDERNCIKQVISKIHGATSVMSKLELHRYCIKALIENSLLARQGDMLSSLLNSQVRFLQKYSEQTKNYVSSTTTKSPDDLINFGKYHYQDQVNTIVTEVAIIVRSFRTTLTGALCTNIKDNIIKRIDKITNIDEDLEQELPHPTYKWTPFSCLCDGAFCANLTNCNPRCQKLCKQQQVLTEFSCKSVHEGQNSISLDLVCDGKLDCYDEADEKNCPETGGLSLTATARFEGSKTFDKIIKYLNEMALAREFEPGRVAMTNFGGCMQRLHKLSISLILDLKAFRSRRDQCFNILKDIYAAIVSEVDDEEIQAKAYNFLLTLGKQLIEGLKQTHFGNENVAPAIKCFCRGAECAQMQCGSECVRECFVKHILTQYPCPSSNLTIPVDDLCNKKINCPQAEDEINCKQDICRNYHVKMLRFNINKIRGEYQTAILGKVLEPWCTKVFTELQELENTEPRLSPETLKQTIKKILNDLASTYISFEARLGRNSRRTLKKFLLIATLIMESATACTQ